MDDFSSNQQRGGKHTPDTSVLLSEYTISELIKSLIDPSGLYNRPQDSIGKTIYEVPFLAQLKDDDGMYLHPELHEQVIDYIQTVDDSYMYDPISVLTNHLVCLKFYLQLPNHSNNQTLENAARILETYMQQCSQIELVLPVAFELIFVALERVLVIYIPDLANSFESSDFVSAVRDAGERKIELVKHMIDTRYLYAQTSTILHNLEVLALIEEAGLLGERQIDWDLLADQFLSNQPLLSSPSSTATLLHKSGASTQKHNDYLNSLIFLDHTPVIFPIDTFELTWILSILSDTGSLGKLNTNIANLIKEYYKEIITMNGGVPWSTSHNLPDLDNTAVAYRILLELGDKDTPEPVEIFKKFDSKSGMNCFPYELNSSPSHLLNFIHTGLKLIQSGQNTPPALHQMIMKAWYQVSELMSGESMYTDKWHTSPYYVMATAIKPLRLLRGYFSTHNTTDMQLNNMIERINDQLITNQLEDGSWGNPNLNNSHRIESTLWAMLALRNQGITPEEKQYAYEKAQGFIQLEFFGNLQADVTKLPPQWIGKVRFSPGKILKVLAYSV